MSEPRVAVFDLGKVLVDFDYGIAARALATRARLAHPEIRALIDQSPLLYRYEIGAINKEEFYKEVCAATGYCGELDEFGITFGDIFSGIPAMIQLHQRLRERNIPTYIFSNTNELAVAHIRKHFPFFGTFTDYIFSYEHGAMKPDPKLYEVVERITKAASGELLYIDDRLENVETGMKRGWKVIHHREPGATISAVQKLGLL